METHKYNSKAIIAVVIAGIGVPLVNAIYDYLPFYLTAVITMLAIAAIIYMLADRRNVYKKAEVIPETCSDIESAVLNLNGGNYVLRKSSGFALESGTKSHIVNGVWYVENTKEHTASGAVAIINVPESFTFKDLKIRLNSGNLLIEGVAAENVLIESRSCVQAKNIFAKNVTINNHSGDLSINAAIHGNITLYADGGSLDTKLRNSIQDFNVNTVVHAGVVFVNGVERGTSEQTNPGALFNAKIVNRGGFTRLNFTN